jgi:hypothetical protein
VVADLRGHAVGMDGASRRGAVVRLSPAVVALALVLSACGGGDGGATLSPSTAARLHRDVEVIRRAAQSGDRQAAMSGLDRFAETVRRAARRGRISASELDGFRRLVRQTRHRLAVALPAAGAPRARAAPAAPAEGRGDEHGSQDSGRANEEQGTGRAPKGDGRGKAKANGHAKGKGHGKGGR